jgi:hypothetical protein
MASTLLMIACDVVPANIAAHAKPQPVESRCRWKRICFMPVMDLGL